MTTDPDREAGETFAAEDIGWIDTETRHVGASLKEMGAYRYMDGADVILFPFAIGDGPIEVVQARDWRDPVQWHEMPKEFRLHHEKVLDGAGIWCATNAVFDRAAWNFGTAGFPFMESHHIIDAACQFAASGLPVALDGAAKYVGLEGKVKAGKELIQLFCVQGASPLEHVAEWEEFVRYAGVDVEQMREAFHRSRQLPFAEWREYWAAERVNARGMPVDIGFAQRCARLAATDSANMKKELAKLTDGAVTTVNQVQRIVTFLLGLMTPTARAILEKSSEEIDEETGEIVEAAAYQLNRDRINKLLAYIPSHRERFGRDADMDLAERILQIRLYGGSKTPAKYSKLLTQAVGDRLPGQYVFNGAQQTGRFSSKGVQVHNLARAALDYEPDLIDEIADGADYADVARSGDETPVSRKLSLLIRPTIVAPPRKVLVWSDFEQIEARVLPWLADSEGGLERLQIFRDVDNDPHKHDKGHPDRIPDQYTRTAAVLSGVSVLAITAELRQRGKVAELALGFGGGAGSLHSMGANYGMHFDDEEAKRIVADWRAANQWAVKFWGVHNEHASYGLWGAINQALENPGHFFECGRVGYIYLADYLGGSLLCQLPSGRFLTYRAIRWDNVAVKDDRGNVVGSERKLRFGRGYGRVNLWHGLAAENVTQAAAADLLRDTLVTLEYTPEYEFMPVVLHTHDEIGSEVDEDRQDDAKAVFAKEMRRPRTWTTGLPIMSEETVGYQYTKHKGSTW